MECSVLDTDLIIKGLLYTLIYLAKRRKPNDIDIKADLTSITLSR